jgi:hypothetical protein
MPDSDRKRGKHAERAVPQRDDDPRDDGRGDHPHKEGATVSGHEANPYDKLPSKPIDTSGEVF